MRIMSFIFVSLTLGTLFCFFYINILQKDIKRLEAEKNGFRIELQREREVKENVREREKVVGKLVEKDKKVFDWRADIGNTSVVNELQVKCKSCSDTAY